MATEDESKDMEIEETHEEEEVSLKNLQTPHTSSRCYCCCCCFVVARQGCAFQLCLGRWAAAICIMFIGRHHLQCSLIGIQFRLYDGFVPSTTHKKYGHSYHSKTSLWISSIPMHIAIYIWTDQTQCQWSRTAVWNQKMECGSDVVLGYMCRHVCYLSQFLEWTIHWISGQPIPNQWQWTEHCLWQLWTCVPFGLHPAMAQNTVRLSIVQ